MTDREIMQQALSAFEAIMFEKDTESCQIIAKNARYSLREALAQPEQAPVAWVERDGELIWHDINAAIGKNLYTAPISEPVKERISEPLANQEPVAYWNGQDLIRRAEEVSSVPNWTDYYHIPLYLKPQSKPLIALTDEEIEETFFDMQQYVKVDLKAFARAIEAKLKEKNT